ncbi:MAG: hypothetical protein EBU03_06965, partial [Methylophilaceae bacterium]|nr:hypothetical protein [Methylophilaceae bacterium]
STFIDDSHDKLQGSFNYATSLYNEETIIRLLETYTKILKQLAELTNNRQKQEQVRIENLTYLNQDQHTQIVNTWNETDKLYPDNKTIQQLFEEQVEKTPNNIAVVYEETKLTYRQLNKKANQLANHLRQNNNISPDTLIALCLDRSEHMLIAILAVLKAGGAYVPMDPSYPDERIVHILTDTNTKVVLTNEIHQERLQRVSHEVELSNRTDVVYGIGASRTINHEIKIIAIDNQELQEQLSSKLASNPNTEATSSNLAYVIYTSGTTGNPKGVMIEHKGVVNLTITQAKELRLNYTKDIKNCLWYANYVFDAHVWEIYASIINGHAIHIVNRNIRQDLRL